jgi:hypothetical protein
MQRDGGDVLQGSITLSRDDKVRLDEFDIRAWMCRCGQDCCAPFRKNLGARLVLLGVGLAYDLRRVPIFQHILFRYSVGMEKGRWMLPSGDAVCRLAYARLHGLSLSTLKYLGSLWPFKILRQLLLL